MLPLFYPLLCSVIENSLNYLIFNQQGLLPAYLRLKNRSLRVSLNELAQPFTLIFNEQCIDIINDSEFTADCQLKTNLANLAKLKQRDKLADTIIVTGDIQVLQHFASLIDLIEWDPTEYLAPYIGDIAAESLRMVGEKIQHHCCQFLHQNSNNVVLAIQEEWRLSPGKLEVIHFYDQIMELNDQVNALSIRIHTLESSS